MFETNSQDQPPAEANWAKHSTEDVSREMSIKASFQHQRNRQSSYNKWENPLTFIIYVGTFRFEGAEGLLGTVYPWKMLLYHIL